MIKVALEGAEFYAYHGFYPEEQILGTRFFADVQVMFDTPGTLDDDKINDTVNYEELYSIIKAEMAIPRKLIETVVQAIVNRIAAAFPFINYAEVTIKKMNPALGGPVENSAVTIIYHNDRSK